MYARATHANPSTHAAPLRKISLLCFDPSYALDSNADPTLGFDPDSFLNFGAGLGSRFCSPSRLRVRYRARSNSYEAWTSAVIPLYRKTRVNHVSSERRGHNFPESHLGLGRVNGKSHVNFGIRGMQRHNHCQQKDTLEYAAWSRPRGAMTIKQGYEVSFVEHPLLEVNLLPIFRPLGHQQIIVAYNPDQVVRSPTSDRGRLSHSTTYKTDDKSNSAAAAVRVPELCPSASLAN
ncbi:hypothetical protein EVAR_6423_1 [Eumeta japonica]|uniref:Uncharacterized protein n=1 Tax=Eumeta variegata TaxID=151549 RepID=A0A4C1TDR1_EUMVA|nr:hypothetical protein EVAR_6423_1 [Eumeta japonica]